MTSAKILGGFTLLIACFAAFVLRAHEPQVVNALVAGMLVGTALLFHGLGRRIERQRHAIAMAQRR